MSKTSSKVKFHIHILFLHRLYATQPRRKCILSIVYASGSTSVVFPNPEGLSLLISAWAPNSTWEVVPQCVQPPTRPKWLFSRLCPKRLSSWTWYREPHLLLQCKTALASRSLSKTLILLFAHFWGESQFPGLLQFLGTQRLSLQFCS